jgi:hypothetical protein
VLYTFKPGDKITKYNYLHVFLRFKHLYSLKIINISKIKNMCRAIKTSKHNIIVTDAPSIRLTFPVIKVYVDELSSVQIWQHKLCATLSANVNIIYCLPIKVYYRICTVRHIRMEIIHGSQNVFRAFKWVGRY